MTDTHPVERQPAANQSGRGEGRPAHFQAAAALRLAGIEKRYGDVRAIAALDLEVPPGEWLTLLGPSGSGKSTTLAIVAGFEQPTKGAVWLGDREITGLPTHKRQLGMVFQGYALFPHMSVWDNVAFALKRQGVRGQELRDRVAQALAAVALQGMEQRRPRELSGGQQQRAALARAIVHGPPLLLMDEPLSALDKALRKQMQVELRRIHKTLGTTVLYVTHDQEEALSLSDRIVVMDNGRVAQVGTPREIYEEPATRFVAEFIGEGNFLALRDCARRADGTVRGATADGTTIVGRCGQETSDATRATLMLRPEDAVIEPPAADGWNRLAITPTEMVYLGDRIRCVGRTRNGEGCLVWADHAAGRRLALGEEVEIGWPQERSVVLELGGPGGDA